MDIRENQLGVSLARSDRETVAGETMSCTVCKHAFVQVAGLLQALKGENLKVEDFWHLAPLKAALANVK